MFFFFSILFSYSRSVQLPCTVEELPRKEACVSFRLVQLVLLFVVIHNKVTFAITQFAIQFFSCYFTSFNERTLKGPKIGSIYLVSVFV